MSFSPKKSEILESDVDDLMDSIFGNEEEPSEHDDNDDDDEDDDEEDDDSINQNQEQL